jgi:hypothetical protein
MRHSLRFTSVSAYGEPLSVRLSSRIHFFLLICLLRLGFAPSLFAQWLPFNPVKNVEPQSDGVLLALENGYLRFHICSDSIVHIVR